MVATPNILTDPGTIYAAPIGTTLPVNTVVGSVFTTSWSSPWVPLGATQDGSDFSFSTSVEPIRVAELFAPVAYRTVEQTGSLAMALADYTASNLSRAFNAGAGAAVATSGSTTTALYTVEPTDPGSEVRIMLGWQSLDNTVRLICRQTLQGGEVAMSFKKAPANTTIPVQFNLEQPTSGKLFSIYLAGSARGGT